jgi:hypothetical protein
MKSRLQEFDNAEGFKRLLRAHGSATTDEVAAVLGISRASYYRLVDMFVNRLYGLKESQPLQQVQPSAPWFQEMLLALTEAHPKWGCYKLANALAATKKVSGPTIQKALARLGLDTWEKRFAQKEKILTANMKQFLELSDAEKQPMIKNNPCLADAQLLANCRPDIEILAANVLEVTPSAESQHRYLLVVVSLHTHIVYLEGWKSGKFSSSVAIDGRERAKNWIVSRKIPRLGTHLMMQANSRSPFQDLDSAFLHIGIRHVSKSGTPATLHMINKVVMKEVMPHYKKTLQLDGEEAAADYLRRWILEHNHKARLGFPTFGKSPEAQCDSLAQSQAGRVNRFN